MLRRQKPGEPISARTINDAIDLIESASNLRVAAPLASSRTAAGLVVRDARPAPIWMKITSGTNPYAWTEQLEASGGTWTNGFLSGTTSLDPAYEANAVATVPANKVVRARRGADGSWRFWAGTC